jgi:RbcX protein
MDLKQVAKDTSKVLSSYLTYQALKTVMAQLSETNPPQALWLSGFAARHSVQDGEAFLQALLQEQQELAFRLMTLRKHLAEEVADYLPEMVRSGIEQANMEHQRHHLERLVQQGVTDSSSYPKEEKDS